RTVHRVSASSRVHLLSQRISAPYAVRDLSAVDLRCMNSQELNRPRGRRVGLTQAKVLAEALAIIDREGAQALTMRRLGAQLGVEAMTIYHYVQNKDELFDRLLEGVFDRSLPEDAWEGPWQEALRRYAHRLLAALTAHP